MICSCFDPPTSRAVPAEAYRYRKYGARPLYVIRTGDIGNLTPDIVSFTFDHEPTRLSTPFASPSHYGAVGHSGAGIARERDSGRLRMLTGAGKAPACCYITDLHLSLYSAINTTARDPRARTDCTAIIAILVSAKRLANRTLSAPFRDPVQ